jgi:Zn-dependent peptidase ImmA (M78 family)
MIGYVAASLQTNEMMRASALSVLETYGISQPPVNIYQILKEEEVRVDFWPFSENIEGLYLRNVTGAGIALNSIHPQVKQRFTGGHELKHHLHDDPTEVAMLSCSNENKQRIEYRANSFSAELLVPLQILEIAVKQLADDLFSITTLSRAFRVSYDTIVYRLKANGTISGAQIKQLLDPTYRETDRYSAYKHRDAAQTARLTMPSLVVTLRGIEGINYCSHCSEPVLDGSWQVCASCSVQLAI